MNSQEKRNEYAAAKCNTREFATTTFYGWSAAMYVERHTLAAWQAFDDVMRLYDYRFRESAGGTYNCRTISGSSNYSLHSYGLCLDLNPSKNPYGPAVITDMPKAFRDAVKAIETTQGVRCFEWGGDWSGNKDTMHWEIDATKAQLSYGVVSPSAPSRPSPPPNEEDTMLPLQRGDGAGDRAYKKADVAHVQFLFSKLHPDQAIEADGVFGAATEAALRANGYLATNGRMQGNQYGKMMWEVGRK